MPNISFRATMRKSACTRQYTQVAVTLAWYSWCQCRMKCVPSVGFWSSLQLVLYFSETCYSKLHVCYCSSSLFWQRETPHDNNRRHEGDLSPRITRGKSFSLFCLYLSPRLLTLRLRLHLRLHLAHWFFFFIYPWEGFRWACMLRFKQRTVSHSNSCTFFMASFGFRGLSRPSVDSETPLKKSSVFHWR